MVPFEDRVVSWRSGGYRVHLLPTAARDIVSFRGSFRSCPDMGENEDLVQELVVSMLDKGTRRHTRHDIAEVLDNLGAHLSFFSDGLRVGFSGRVLRDDLRTVASLLVELLTEPTFDEDELDKAKTRAIAAARRRLESTSEQASSALHRGVFPADHPNFSISPADSIAFLEGVTADRVRGFHEDHFGARDFEIVFVGDVERSLVEDALGGPLSSWPDHNGKDRFADSARPRRAGTSFVSMPDKPNADISMGQAVSIRRDDPQYIPLFVANYVLGGNFSARLMARIRDEMGLTYGIRSSLSGFGVEFDGLWDVSVTLSTENIERGVEATQAELDRFVAHGVTGDELEEKKTTITGSFKVGLGTTVGLARSLLANVERGFGCAYLDRYPREIEETTLDAVNAAVRDLLEPPLLHVATAGSLTSDG